MAALLKGTWHRFRIKTLLFSGSVSSERSSSSAPSFLRTESPLGSPLSPQQRACPLLRNVFSFIHLDFTLSSRSLFGSVNRGIWFFVVVVVVVRTLSWLLVCAAELRNVFAESGGGWQIAVFFFFFFLNGGGTCSGGVRAPRSGWESGAFVAKLWRWSCVHVCVRVTNCAMRKTSFNTSTSTTTSAEEVRAMASLRRSL